MTQLHLIRDASDVRARDVLSALQAQESQISVALIGSGTATDLGDVSCPLYAPSGGVDWDKVVDLVFEADSVVTW
ncbi:MAG: hypothetical protein ACE5FN_03840 [Leptospirillia bacterium]